MLDTYAATAIIALAVGILIGAVLVYAARGDDATLRHRAQTAEQHYAREALDNLTLRAENVELRTALAAKVGHPSVRRGDNVVPIRGAR